MIVRGRAAAAIVAGFVSTQGHTALSVDGYRHLAMSEAASTMPYRDQAGVLTVCYGETKNVEMREYSLDECSAMLVRRVEGYFVPRIRDCTPPAVWGQLPQKTRDSLVEFAYNVGVGGYCGSSVRKRLTAGRGAEACERMLLWNKIRVAGALRVNRGLTIRRGREAARCSAGFADAA